MQLVGRYRLVRPIASGGMGEVWEGTMAGEAGFSRRVAIKRMFPERESDPAFARMFLDEARIVSQLHHANIVSIIDTPGADPSLWQVQPGNCWRSGEVR